jgi:NTE family protein
VRELGAARRSRMKGYESIALVLQGGGALGAYQAGVFEGLHEARIEPNWAAGISIGAINAALIAGNAPSQRMAKLREFWTTVSAPPVLPPTDPWVAQALQQGGDIARTALGWFGASRALLEGQRGFFAPRVPSPALLAHAPPDTLGHYDTSPLKGTLERLVDFDRINDDAHGMRLTVWAVNVATGNFEAFDSRRGRWAHRLRAEHIMASGALPPGFGAVAIDGEHYWDGGLVSNTPLSAVLDETPRRDTLAFQVDLWSASGPLPKNLADVEERAKDIRYSSRTRAVTEQLERERELRRLLREVLESVPESRRRGSDWCSRAQTEASDKKFNVVHLIYKEKPWDLHYKDYEFGALTINEHWASGLVDIRATLADPGSLAPPPERRSTVTHDVHRKPAE